jgi:hypothetical protein
MSRSTPRISGSARSGSSSNGREASGKPAVAPIRRRLRADPTERIRASAPGRADMPTMDQLRARRPREFSLLHSDEHGRRVSARPLGLAVAVVDGGRGCAPADHPRRERGARNPDARIAMQNSGIRPCAARREAGARPVADGSRHDQLQPTQPTRVGPPAAICGGCQLSIMNLYWSRPRPPLLGSPPGSRGAKSGFRSEGLG